MEQFTEKELMMGLWFGEARMVEDSIMDEIREYLAIGHTVLNRVILPTFPNTIKTVILQPRQFSCFNTDDPNRERILRFLTEQTPGDSYNRLKTFSEMLIAGRTRDFSGGADHYVARWFFESARADHWCKRMKITEVWGGHIFLKEKYL